MKQLRKAPSEAQLIKRFGVDRYGATQIRVAIHDSATALEAIKKIASRDLIVNYGVEDLILDRSYCGRDWASNIPFGYINTGDTYSPTLIARDDRVFISCWGDEYDRLPQCIKDVIG